MGKNIIARECRFVTHLRKTETREDTHLVKELIHYEDGTKEPFLRILKNYLRPFYVTKEHFRNHKDKKESELLSRLIEYHSTESDLAENIAKRLKGTFPRRQFPTMYDVSASPYLYGTDISTANLIKHAYSVKYPDVNTPFRVAIFDIETDTLTEEIIVASLCLDNKVYIGILKKLLENKIKPIEQLEYLYQKHIPETDISKNITPVFKILDTELQLIEWIMNQAHQEQPDLVAVWNIDYDVPYIVKRCEHYGVDPKYIFSDPKLPEELKHFDYIEGSKSKVTASGVFKPKDPQEQWHSVIASSSFYWVDAMCTYYFVRQGGKTVPGGYSLDNILNFELGSNYKKLKFENMPEDLIGLDWHRYMVQHKPLEYIIYNIWDTMSVLHLDAKTKDLSLNLPLLNGYSHFNIFHQNPKKLVESIHYDYLDNGRVLAVRSKRQRNSNIDSGVDVDLLGLDEWVVTQPIERTTDSGLKCLQEDPELPTLIRAHVYDSDQVSGYPNDTISANVSGDTTSRELISIEGIEKDLFKTENLNCIYGNINAIQYCTTMFNFPELKDLKIL